MPKISIIVPVYKAERYLHQCIDSILNQTFYDFEVLLINDGSPDNSDKICNDYAKRDNRIRVYHKKNGGVSSARNWGLNEMNGDWVTFVDSDDTISPNMLEVCYNQVCTNKLDFLQFSLTRVECWNNFDGVKTKPCNLSEYVNTGKLNVSIGGNFIKSSIINKSNIRFDESLNLAEDMLFVLSCLSHCNLIQKIDHQLYYYRDNSISASHNKRTRDLLNSCVAEWIFKKNNPIFIPMIDYSIAHYLISIIINNDYNYTDLENIIKNNIPFNKRLMRKTLWLFASTCNINIDLAINIIRWKYKYLK